MSEFKDFIRYDDLIDKVIQEVLELDTHQPKDGKWDHPLTGDWRNSYAFNVPGDNCGDERHPCYKVYMSGDENEISIGFARAGSHSDEYRGVGMDVFKGVLSGLGQYLSVKMPKKLQWSPVSKSLPNPHTHRIVNPQARASVYEKWAIRHLFPDKYVGMSGNWIRRDVYDSEYIPKGYPPIPEGIGTDPNQRVKAHQELAKKTKDAEDERERIEQEEYRRRREEEERRRQEEERRQQELLRQSIEDNTQNPNHLAAEDIVFVTDSPANERLEGRLGKISNFRLGDRWNNDDESLYANVYFSDEDDPDDYYHMHIIKASRLKKESPEAAAERNRQKAERLQAAIDNPQQNPTGLQVGDDIITWMQDSPNSEQNGLKGKVINFEMSRYATGLSAKIEWDERAKEVLRYRANNALDLTRGYVHKHTPEIEEQIRRKKQEYEIEQEVIRGRERHERRQQRAAGENIAQPSPEELQELINHPLNPLHLKPGDYVKSTSGYYGYSRRGRSSSNPNRVGVIISMEKQTWSNNITAYVRWNGSTARPTRFYVNQLTRDESPATQRRIARQQQLSQQTQTIQSAASGLQIGDTASVTQGINRGKSGRILGFRTSTANNVVASLIDSDGRRFTANTRYLVRPTQAESIAWPNFGFYPRFLPRNRTSYSHKVWQA